MSKRFLILLDYQSIRAKAAELLTNLGITLETGIPSFLPSPLVFYDVNQLLVENLKRQIYATSLR
jgi:hypothetical protein